MSLVRLNALLFSLFTTHIASASPQFDGTITSIVFMNADPRSGLTSRYDAFCLERPGFLVTLPWDAVQFFEEANVEIYDMGMAECPHGWDMHLMGHRYFTGLGSSEMAAVYPLEQQDGSSLWVTVWFWATHAEAFVSEGKRYIRARVHNMYCADNSGDPCWIDMELPE